MSADSFDRRLTPARADLAAAHLRGLVDAPRYAEGQAMRIIAASAPLRRSPRRGARGPVRADASGRGAADARLSRPGDQAAAAHGALARRAADDRGPRRR